MTPAGARDGTVRVRAPGKVNLVLQVGPRRADGLHELCSLFASIELADELEISERGEGGDLVRCEGVEGPNICAAALTAFRAVAPCPPLEVEIRKRIPVAAGLGGGSADAAAVLRVANELAGGPLSPERLREVGARVGADVPSQVDPGHALVTGAGERVEPFPLPRLWLVLVPQASGLSTADVYAEADRLRSTRTRLDPGRLRRLAGKRFEELAEALENDLQPAALSLRPELAAPLEGLRRAGAPAALVTGAGPTVIGVFADERAARRAARSVPAATVSPTAAAAQR